jgi:hypothetical protein
MTHPRAHPTDRVRLPKRSRSEQATERLDTAAHWLDEIDQVLGEGPARTTPDILVEPMPTSEGSPLASHIPRRNTGRLEAD